MSRPTDEAEERELLINKPARHRRRMEMGVHHLEYLLRPISSRRSKSLPDEKLLLAQYINDTIIFDAERCVPSERSEELERRGGYVALDDLMD